MAVSAFTLHPFYFVIGIFIYGFGDSIFAPPFNGTLSKSVTEHQQGQIQGSSQALQALTRILGPIIGDNFMFSSALRLLPAWELSC